MPGLRVGVNFASSHINSRNFLSGLRVRPSAKGYVYAHHRLLNQIQLAPFLPWLGMLPKKARVAIVGGGVIGCSVAYHLTKLGWKDVVLLERKQLTSGTTWHAAGLIAQLRNNGTQTRLAKYSQELYGTLEQETGVATGFRRW
jgi:glutamate dehydrogenase/leucine dehydrogenase